MPGAQCHVLANTDGIAKSAYTYLLHAIHLLRDCRFETQLQATKHKGTGWHFICQGNSNITVGDRNAEKTLTGASF